MNEELGIVAEVDMDPTRHLPPYGGSPSLMGVVLLLAPHLGFGPATAAAQDGSGAENAEVVFREDFSAGLEQWQGQRLDRRETRFAVVQAGSNAVLAATSQDAAGALSRRIPGGPTSGESLSWRWRVEKSLAENRAERSPQGDDYAARVLVLFGSEELSDDTRALAYAWAGNEPEGSIYPNPTLPQVRTIVLRSGDGDSDRWLVERRDLASDYRRAFGGQPPPVTAIAIVVDTDDTGGEATAWFDDLELRTAAPTATRSAS